MKIPVILWMLSGLIWAMAAASVPARAQSPRLTDQYARVGQPGSTRLLAGTAVDRAGAGAVTSITIGSGTSTSYVPLRTSYHDTRTQVIYPASQIGKRYRIYSLALNLAVYPSQTLNAWTIRMKHTTRADYSASASWETADWTTVYQTNQVISRTGWVQFNFATPFDYNGIDNLMIDFSYNNGSASSSAYVYATPATSSRVITCSSDSAYGDPLTWSGATPAPTAGILVPNIQLGVGNLDPMTLTPSTGLTALGFDYGGPFAPMYTTYTLANGGTTPFNWITVVTVPWLTLTPAQGTLAPGAKVVVKAALNSSISTMAAGVYEGTLNVFSLATAALETRPVQLTVSSANPVAFVHTPLADTTRTTSGYIVDAKITARAGLNTASPRLVYSTDGGGTTQVLAMASLGSGNYRATIPAKPLGTVVHYCLQARDLAGRAGAAPAAGAAGSNYYMFRVGYPRLAVTVNSALNRSVLTSKTLAVPRALTIKNTGYGSTTWKLMEKSSHDALAAPPRETPVAPGVHVGSESPAAKQSPAPARTTIERLPPHSAGPDGGGYTYIDNRNGGGPAFDWIEISGSGTNLNLSDDAHYFPINLPFAFTFYHTPYTQVAVGSNGTVYFENKYLGLSNVSIPSANGYGVNRFIAVYWDDLHPSGANNVYYKIVGAAPSRTLVVQWQNVAGITCQAQLAEAGSTILLLYQNPGGTAGAYATVGIQGDASTGLQYLCNASGLTANLAILFARGIDWLNEDVQGGTLAAGQSVDVALTYNAQSLLPGYGDSGALEITNDIANSTATLPVGISVYSNLAVTPARYDFNTVRLGRSASASFIVRNNSAASLTGSARVPPPFSIASGSPYTLAPGASTTVVVNYTPVAELQTTATVSFTGAEGAYSTVTGRGVDKILTLAGINTAAFPKVQLNAFCDTAKGRAGQLKAANFTLSENGKSQRIDACSFVPAGTSLADIVVLMDDTGSMDLVIEAMKTQARRFAEDIDAAGVNARFALVSFKDTAETDLDLTDDVVAFESAVSRLTAIGGGDKAEAALDAVHLANAQNFRPGAARTFLLITDAPTHYRNDGTSFSQFTMPEIVSELRASGVTVFTVSPNLTSSAKPSASSQVALVDNDLKQAADLLTYPNDSDLRKLSDETNGIWQDIKSSDFSLMIKRVVNALCASYTLTYTTTNTAMDGSTHTVLLTLNDPDLGKDTATGTYFVYSDRTPPVSSIWTANLRPPNLSMPLFWFASDPDGIGGSSGVVAVDIYWRRFGDPYQRLGRFSPPTANTTFDARVHGGPGRYDFYTIATDRAGNVEPTPAQPDCTVWLSSTGAAPQWAAYP